MKKLEKLTLKELENHVSVLDGHEQLLFGGGSISTEDWNSLSGTEKAQYIVDAWLAGDGVWVEGASGPMYQSGGCGDNVVINGNTYNVIVSAGLNSSYDYGYQTGNVYTNSCNTYQQTYIGGNHILMVNVEAEQSEDFYNDVNESLNN